LVFLKTAIGIICFSSGITGFQLRRLSVPERAFMIVASLLFFSTNPSLNAAGLAILGVSLLVQKKVPLR